MKKQHQPKKQSEKTKTVRDPKKPLAPIEQLGRVAGGFDIGDVPMGIAGDELWDSED